MNTAIAIAAGAIFGFFLVGIVSHENRRVTAAAITRPQRPIAPHFDAHRDPWGRLYIRAFYRDKSPRASVE